MKRQLCGTRRWVLVAVVQLSIEFGIVRLCDRDRGMGPRADTVAPGPWALRGRDGTAMEATLDAFGQAVYLVGQVVPATVAAALAAGAAGGTVVLMLLVGDLDVGEIVWREVDWALRGALVGGILDDFVLTCQHTHENKKCSQNSARVSN